MIVNYWTTFARKGDPNSSKTPFWPRYTEAQDPIQLLQLPEPVTVNAFAERHHCGFWEHMGVDVAPVSAVREEVPNPSLKK